MTSQSKPFTATVTRTPAGSVRIQLRAPTLTDTPANQRQLAACLYDLAAELERRSAAIGARWAISPDAFNARVDVELQARDDAEVAAKFVAEVLIDLGLA